jgi:hypothetical protein
MEGVWPGTSLTLRCQDLPYTLGFYGLPGVVDFLGPDLFSFLQPANEPGINPDVVH